MRRRRHLVVARVGRNSLHPRWLDGAEERSWDLHLCPFEPLPEAALEGCSTSDVIVGPKWAGLNELLTRWDGWRDYEQIWLPDDDLLTDAGNIDSFFATTAALGWSLSAPALDEDSYYAHYSTMRNRRCTARCTGFVEIMAPCFSGPTLDRLLPTFSLSTTGWGWGLDSVWPRLLDYQNMGVIDATPVCHTRPVGAFRDATLAARVLAESDRLLAEYGCEQVHRVFQAFGPDLKPLLLGPSELTALLVDGWQYLLPGNPALLPWMVQAQAPADGWPAYPVAGTPAHATRGRTLQEGV
ncbi:MULTISPECIES: DUF707 domain-containing protein [unclassified Roseateles]|uniref:DUF707 domain-containing protein n=1 Tax=unclassified Roseateles TaxID=2626991 RepID=UPI000AD26796|nr:MULTISPECIES: DUF707 domain-containing protein [unclassified Roseateles]